MRSEQQQQHLKQQQQRLEQQQRLDQQRLEHRVEPMQKPKPIRAGIDQRFAKQQIEVTDPSVRWYRKTPSGWLIAGIVVMFSLTIVVVGVSIHSSKKRKAVLMGGEYGANSPPAWVGGAAHQLPTGEWDESVSRAMYN